MLYHSHGGDHPEYNGIGEIDEENRKRIEYMNELKSEVTACFRRLDMTREDARKIARWWAIMFLDEDESAQDFAEKYELNEVYAHAVLGDLKILEKNISFESHFIFEPLYDEEE